MNSLRYKLSKRPDGADAVVLSGAIDESADLQLILGALEPSSEVVLNLEGIDRINSIGVHRWLPFIGALSERRRVTVEVLSYPMVMQANTVARLFANATVRSCLAPYFCQRCNQSRMVLVAAEEARQDRGAPRRGCEVCGSAMEFDELDEYFTFFRSPQGS